MACPFMALNPAPTPLLHCPGALSTHVAASVCLMAVTTLPPLQETSIPSRWGRFFLRLSHPSMFRVIFGTLSSVRDQTQFRTPFFLVGMWLFL